jgi:hypothetical protein
MLSRGSGHALVNDHTAHLMTMIPKIVTLLRGLFQFLKVDAEDIGVKGCVKRTL